MIDTRKYNEEDIERIYEIVTKSFNIESDIEILKNNLKENNINCNVICYNKEIVGCIFLTYYNDIVKGTRIGKIDYFCIDPNFRGKGFGKVLLDFTIQNESIFKHVDELILTSSPKRETARKIYTEFGFEIKDTNLFVKKLGE